MYLDNKAIWYVTTLSVKLQEKFSNLFSFMLRDRFSPISSLFFKICPAISLYFCPFRSYNGAWRAAPPTIHQVKDLFDYAKKTLPAGTARRPPHRARLFCRELRPRHLLPRSKSDRVSGLSAQLSQQCLRRRVRRHHHHCERLRLSHHGSDDARRQRALHADELCAQPASLSRHAAHLPPHHRL